MTSRRNISWPMRFLIGSRPRLTLIRTAILAVVCVFFFKYAVRPVMIDGASMEPTIRDRSFGFVNLLAYRNSPPERGDVVIIEKDGFDTMYLKRIIGLPGETVGFRDGELLVNGEKTPEPYLQSTGEWDMRTIRLNSGQYLVAGDNRDVDRKQHVMGIADKRHIMGRLIGQ